MTTSPSDRELSVLRTYTAASQLLFMVEGEVPASRADPHFVLPLTGKPDAADTKTQIGRG